MNKHDRNPGTIRIKGQSKTQQLEVLDIVTVTGRIIWRWSGDETGII